VSVSSAWIPVHPRSIPGGRRSDRAPAGRCAIRVRRGTRRVPGDPQERERYRARGFRFIPARSLAVDGATALQPVVVRSGSGGARVACPAIRGSVSVSSAWTPVHARSLAVDGATALQPVVVRSGSGGARVACPAIRRSVSVTERVDSGSRSIPGGRRSDRAPAGRCAIRIRRGTRRVPGDPQERERIERVDSGSRSIPGGRRSDRAPAGRCAIRIRRGTRRVPGDPRERERIERVDSSSSPLDPWRSTERPRSSRSLCDPDPEGHASRARRSAGA
jgi:hypothetical protein